MAAVAGKAETAKDGLWVTENRPSVGRWGGSACSREHIVSPQHRSDKNTMENHVMPGQLTRPGEAAGTLPGKSQALGGQGHMGGHSDDMGGFNEHKATWN